MATDLIGYGRLVEEALRHVVREALVKAAREGIPDPHHFYITFRTDHPGVAIPASLRERYPSEMTIVLQHQFWDLEVDDRGFGVNLSFSGVPRRLVVPFAAVKVFADPSVEFGLQFQVDITTPDFDEAPQDALPADRADESEGGAEVVTLDRFRRK